MRSAGRSRSVEKFTGVELGNWYVRKFGAKFLRQTGSHIFYELPDGTVVGTLHGATNVPCSLTRQVARELGMSRPEVCAAVGYPIQKSSKPKKGAPTRSPKPSTYTKGEAMRALSELAAVAGGLRDGIRAGARDPEVYRAICESAAGARRSIDEVVDRYSPRKSA